MLAGRVDTLHKMLCGCDVRSLVFHIHIRIEHSHTQDVHSMLGIVCFVFEGRQSYKVGATRNMARIVVSHQSGGQ